MSTGDFQSRAFPLWEQMRGKIIFKQYFTKKDQKGFINGWYHKSGHQITLVKLYRALKYEAAITNITSLWKKKSCVNLVQWLYQCWNQCGNFYHGHTNLFCFKPKTWRTTKRLSGKRNAKFILYDGMSLYRRPWQSSSLLWWRFWCRKWL